LDFFIIGFTYGYLISLSNCGEGINLCVDFCCAKVKENKMCIHYHVNNNASSDGAFYLDSFIA